MRGRRGQAHTLEAVIAALVLLASVGFALQMTAVTPLSASTSSQHLENQLKGTADGILQSESDRGGLKHTILFWNPNDVNYYNATDEGYYTTFPPNTSFGKQLNQSFNRQRIAYNVHVVFHTQSGNLDRRRLIYSGEPSDNAVSATEVVAIMDSDRVKKITGEDDSVEVDNSGANFYMDDVNADGSFLGTGDGPLFNLVRVELTVWRI